MDFWLEVHCAGKMRKMCTSALVGDVSKAKLFFTFLS